MIRLGTTHTAAGPDESQGVLQLHVWQLYMAKQPTYVINGTTYGIELISYLDDEIPGDGNTTMLLAETLVLVDKVHVLFTPFEGNVLQYFLSIAEQYGVPCLNDGVFELSFLPPFKWVINTLPDITRLGVQCGAPLRAAGAKTLAIGTPTDTYDSASSVGLLQLVAANTGLTIVNPTAYVNVTPEMFVDTSLLDETIKQFRELGADVALFEFTPENNILFIEAMRRNNYNPNGYYVWGTGSYPQVRQALGWKGAWSLTSEAYSPYLQSPDPFWGGTAQYQQLYNSTYGLSTGNTDANLAACLTILDAALKGGSVMDLAPDTLLAALLAVNVSTVVGQISFTNGTVNRPLYCFQNSENASSLLTVWPSGVPSYTPITYPAIIDYPKGYFDQFKKKHSHTTLALAVSFGILGGLLLIGGAVTLFVMYKYELVFVSKKELSPDGGKW